MDTKRRMSYIIKRLLSRDISGLLTMGRHKDLQLIGVEDFLLVNVFGTLRFTGGLFLYV